MNGIQNVQVQVGRLREGSEGTLTPRAMYLVVLHKKQEKVSALGGARNVSKQLPSGAESELRYQCRNLTHWLQVHTCVIPRRFPRVNRCPDG